MKDIIIPKEDRFLLYCCRYEIDTKTKTKIEELLKKGLDWDYMLTKARIEGVHLLLYLIIKDLRIERVVPEKIVRSLKEECRQSTIKDLWFTNEVKRCVSLFKKSGIKTIVMKGVIFKKIIYSNLSYKPNIDIDLLIHKNDLSKVAYILKEEGYILLPSNEEIFWEQDYWHPEKQVLIDLHWHFLNVKEFHKITKIDMKKIWERAIILSIDGIDVLTLSITDTIVFLCLHFANHHIFTSLILLAEISGFICKWSDEICWKEVISRAKAYKIKNSVYFTLCAVKEILGAPVPGFILRALKPNLLRRKVVAKFLFEPRSPDSLLDIEKRNKKWALCSWLIADNIIDSYRAYQVTHQRLKVGGDEGT